jgi:phosphoadenosine phosphosulfate reductase
MTLEARKIDEAGHAIVAALEVADSACTTCSFQIEDMVVLDLVRERAPEIPVLFLETGYHFAEVYQYRDEMTARYGLKLVNLLPQQTVPEQEAQFGLLYQSQPDQCCKLRKVKPLFAALEDYDVWFTGLRRVQSPTRANLQVRESFRLPSGKQLEKISPLAEWSDGEIWQYARERGIPALPLYQLGYTSVGCEPCTGRPSDPGNARSGRWAGRKLECGIHIAEQQ